MSYLVAEGAKLVCSMGSTNARLMLRPRIHTVDDKRIANIEDHKVMRDIKDFGMCTAMANPEVAAKTAAAGGVLTPANCQPPEIKEWSPGAKWIHQVMEGGRRVAALTSDSKCQCVYTGVISIVEPNCRLKVRD